MCYVALRFSFTVSFRVLSDLLKFDLTTIVLVSGLEPML